MAGGAAWAGNEEKCTREWTDCSDCSASTLGAEEAVKQHNIEGFRDFIQMLHHNILKLEYLGEKNSGQGNNNTFLFVQLWCLSVTHLTHLGRGGLR